MALTEICGLSEANYMKDVKFSTNDFYGDIKQNSSNIDNHYQLAVPPFENVRLCRNLITMQFFVHVYIFFFWFFFV